MPADNATNLDAKLDDTLATLSGGLSALDPATALQRIEAWEVELQATGRPELGNIARDLAALRTELADGSLDGGKIGRLLLRLGQQTTTVAGGGGGKLHTLAELLTKAGSVLSPSPSGPLIEGGDGSATGGLRTGGETGGVGTTASGLGTTAA